MEVLFAVIYLIVAIASGCLLGVPIKDYIAGISWIDDSLEISSYHGLSNGTCMFISVIIAVIIAFCLYFLVVDNIENSIAPAIICLLLIPLLVFVASFILTLIGLVIYWLIEFAFLLLIIGIVALVLIFD